MGISNKGTWARIVLGIVIGVALCGIALGVWLQTNFTGAGKWHSAALTTCEPNCTLELKWRTRSIFPPTEYDYAAVVYHGEKQLKLDIVDDSSGGDPVAVHAMQVFGDEPEGYTLLIFSVPNRATVLDLRHLRTCEIDLPMTWLTLPKDLEFLEQGFVDAWGGEYSVVRYRLLSTFMHDPRPGWHVPESQSWASDLLK